MALNLVEAQTLAGFLGQHALHKTLELRGYLHRAFVLIPKLVPPPTVYLGEPQVGGLSCDEGHPVQFHRKQSNSQSVEVCQQRIVGLLRSPLRRELGLRAIAQLDLFSRLVLDAGIEINHFDILFTVQGHVVGLYVQVAYVVVHVSYGGQHLSEEGPGYGVGDGAHFREQIDERVVFSLLQDQVACFVFRRVVLMEGLSDRAQLFDDVGVG